MGLTAKSLGGQNANDSCLYPTSGHLFYTTPELFILALMTSDAMQPKVHEGRNVKRIREILGIKQDALATELGLSQQAVSQLEQKEALDSDIIDKISKALKVNPEAIKNFNEEAAANYFNAFNDNSVSHVIQGDYGTYNFNPLEKLMEALEENKKLYERLLQSEREKLELLKNQKG